MTEHRINELERQVTDLRVENGKLGTSVEHLSESVDALTMVVQQLRDTMNQGRGALWVLTGAAGIVGGIIALAIRSFLGQGLMATFSAASLAKLATCDQRLQDIAKVVIQHVDFTVLQGHRNQADQEAAVAAGTSKLHWPNGNHNKLPSRAMDIAPLSTQPGEKLSWKDVPAFARLMGYVQAVADLHGVKLRFGLDWDGDFRTVGFDPDEKFLDAPHVELAKDEPA